MKKKWTEPIMTIVTLEKTDKPLAEMSDKELKKLLKENEANKRVLSDITN